MTLDEARAVIERARRQSEFIDIEDPEYGAELDGTFDLEELEAIVTVMRAGVAMPVRWSGQSRG